jgi:hypothetical protein
VFERITAMPTSTCLGSMATWSTTRLPVGSSRPGRAAPARHRRAGSHRPRRSGSACPEDSGHGDGQRITSASVSVSYWTRADRTRWEASTASARRRRWPPRYAPKGKLDGHASVMPRVSVVIDGVRWVGRAGSTTCAGGAVQPAQAKPGERPPPGGQDGPCGSAAIRQASICPAPGMPDPVEVPHQPHLERSPIHVMKRPATSQYRQRAFVR